MRYILNLLILFAYSASAQVSVTLMEPKPVGTSVNDVFNAIVITNSALTVNITGVITDVKNNKIAEGVIRQVSLKLGSNTINTNQFTPVYLINNMSNSGNLLTYGKYSFCLRVVEVVTQEEVGEDCKSIDVEVLNPPNLLSPYHEEIIQTKFPLLTWIPVMPSSPQITYDLRVCEILKGQSATDAFSKNAALLFQRNISGNSLQYSINHFPLDTGKQYAWGVYAKNAADEVIGVTDVWMFTIKLSELNQAENIDMKNFVRMKNEPDNSFLYLKDYVRVIYDERYTETTGLLEVLDANKNVLFSKNVEVLRGENRYLISFEDLKGGFDKNKPLLLVFSPEGRNKKYLEFYIKNK